MRIIPKSMNEWVMILMHGLETYVFAVPAFYFISGVVGYPIYGSIHGGLLIAHIASTVILILFGIVIMFKQQSAGITALLVGLIGILVLGVFLLPVAMPSFHP